MDTNVFANYKKDRKSFCRLHFKWLTFFSPISDEKVKQSWLTFRALRVSYPADENRMVEIFSSLCILMTVFMSLP